MLGLLGIGVSMAANNGPWMGDFPASIRLRETASAMLSRTFGTPTTQNTFTVSVWVKRARLGVLQTIIGATGVGFDGLLFNAADQLILYSNGSIILTTAAVFRDPTSWYHIVWKAQGASTTLYVNNVQVGTVASGFSFFNSAIQHIIGQNSSTNLLGSLIARLCILDGQAVNPSSFGQSDSTINEWKTKDKTTIKALVDAAGTNNVMLDFDDPNFATYGVGKDYSSKNNHFTPTNINATTAGTTYDWMLDVPGNSFATWNPEFISGDAPTSNGNLDTSSSYNNWATQPAKFPIYWEEILTSVSAGYPYCGLATPTNGVSQVLGQASNGGKSLGVLPNGQFYYNGSLQATYSSASAGDVRMHAYDPATGKYWAGLNGTWFNSGSPSAGTGQIYTYSPSEDVYPAVSNAGYQHTVCFGQAPLHASATYDAASGGYFRYTPPSGFKALCQANMPTPAILNPEKHFDVATYAGNGATPRQVVTGLQFQPDLAWLKSRTNTQNNNVYDAVRGTGSGKLLITNLTDAEGGDVGRQDSAYGYVSAFNSDGVTVTGGSTDNSAMNQNSQTFVSWLWKAGGAPVTNNAGSITSYVSANTDMGFSIVKFTKTAGTVSAGHGLTKTPDMIVYKNLTTGDWYVYHKRLTNNTDYYLRLNSTSGQTNYAGIWGGAPTSSVIYCSGAMFGAGDIIAYCFHDSDILKVFSYLANGSADGPYIDCGFKPKAIITKAATTTGNWGMLDAVRDPYNTPGNLLYPNLPNAEASAYYTDITSRGFKIKEAGSDRNASGQTYIGIAFADVCGKYALAR